MTLAMQDDALFLHPTYLKNHMGVSRKKATLLTVWFRLSLWVTLRLVIDHASPDKLAGGVETIGFALKDE